jgi:hypothetical protein
MAATRDHTEIAELRKVIGLVSEGDIVGED